MSHPSITWRLLDVVRRCSGGRLSQRGDPDDLTACAEAGKTLTTS